VTDYRSERKNTFTRVMSMADLNMVRDAITQYSESVCMSSLEFAFIFKESHFDNKYLNDIAKGKRTASKEVCNYLVRLETKLDSLELDENGIGADFEFEYTFRYEMFEQPPRTSLWVNLV